MSATELNQYAMAELVQVADSLKALVTELRALNAKVASQSMSVPPDGTPRSSIELKTSARGLDCAVKVYDNSAIGPLIGPAVDAYFETLALAQQRLQGGGA